MFVAAWCLGAVITIWIIMRLLGYPLRGPSVTLLAWIFIAIKLGLIVLIIEHHIVNAGHPSLGRTIIVAVALCFIASFQLKLKIK